MSGFATKTIGVDIDARPARRRGRPLKDGPDRREDIIDASTHLFLKNGYTSTTLRRIAQEADVNVALVHYYFTSKQGLYQEVLNSALQATLTSLKDFQRTPASVSEIASVLTAPLYKHPDLILSVNTPNAPLEAREAAEAVMRRLSLSLTACIKSLQRAGKIRYDLDPELFAQTCLDLCWAPFKSDHSGASDNEETAPTPNPPDLLRRHVEQNTLVLTSAAACKPAHPKSAEKKGDPNGPPFRHFPERVN